MPRVLLSCGGALPGTQKEGPPRVGMGEWLRGMRLGGLVDLLQSPGICPPIPRTWSSRAVGVG